MASNNCFERIKMSQKETENDMDRMEKPVRNTQQKGEKELIRKFLKLNYL